MGRPRDNDPEKERGLNMAKFRVERTDPEAQARHVGCEFFVLDLTHDTFAHAAIMAYAEACQLDYPLLALDLRNKAWGMLQKQEGGR